MSLWRPNKNGVQHCPCVIPALGEQSQKDPGAPCLVGVAESVSSRFREKSLSQKIKRRSNWGRTLTAAPGLHPCTHAFAPQARMCTHRHIYTHNTYVKFQARGEWPTDAAMTTQPVTPGSWRRGTAASPGGRVTSVWRELSFPQA